MNNTVQQLFFLSLAFVTFYGIGKLLLHRSDIDSRFEANFLIGFASYTVIVSFGYQLGIPINYLGVVLSGVGICATIFLKRLIPKIGKFVKRGNNFSKLLSNKNLLFMIPFGFFFISDLIGGLAIRIFQGNHWDYLSYEGIAESISRYSYSELMSGSRNGLTLRDPVTILASNSLQARPNVEIVLASLAKTFDMSILDNTYVFMLVLVTLMALAMSFLTKLLNKDFFAHRTKLRMFFIILFTIGFWGQYLLDIDAISSLSAASLYVFLFGLLLLFFKKPTLFKGYCVGLIEIALMLLYPEGCVFLTPFYGLQIIILLWIYRKQLKSKFWVLFIGTQMSAFLLLSLSAYKPLSFAFNQLSFAGTKASAPWANYFDDYLWGSSGLADRNSIGRLVNVPMGLTGQYFISPRVNVSLSLLELLKWGWALLTIGVFFLVLLVSKQELKKISFLSIPLSIMVVIVPIVALKSTLWVAGKGITYLLPTCFVFFLFLFERSWDSKSKKIQSILLIFIIGWAMSQVYFAFTRIENSQSGIVHTNPPYPSIQLVNMKSSQDWNFNFHDIKKTCSGINLKIEDRFREYYVEMKLDELRIPWSSEFDVNSYFGIGSNLGMMRRIKTDKTCVIQDTSHNNVLRFQLTR